jgi:hypothetical protein
MIKLARSISRILLRRGPGLAGYVLILALIALIAITATLFLSGGLDMILSATGGKSSVPPSAAPSF